MTIFFGFVIFPGSALARPPDLSTTLLSATLPGFVATPSGPTNGPVNQSNLHFFGASASANSAVEAQIACGCVSGYVRTFVHEPLNGDGVVIIAFWFANPNARAAYVAGENFGVRQKGGSEFSVPGIAGASGFSLRTASTPEFAVMFAKGGTAYAVEIVNASGALTSADAVAVATKQAANAPAGDAAPPWPTAVSATPGGSTAYYAGEAVGGVLMTALVAYGGVLLLRLLQGGRRRRSAVSAEPMGIPSGSYSPYSFVPIATAPPCPAGWYPVAENEQEQAYWDGQAWTRRIRWNGEAWIDLPSAQSPVTV